MQTVISDPKNASNFRFKIDRPFKIKQRILQPNLSKYYRFGSADILCEQFNTHQCKMSHSSHSSPYQEDVISETYQRPNKSYFHKTQELDSLINTCKLVQKLLPKEADIDKILKIIQRNVLKGTCLPITVKEIQQDI